MLVMSAVLLFAIVAAEEAACVHDAQPASPTSQPHIQSVKRFPASTDPALLLETIQLDGAVIIEGMFDIETIAEMRSMADAHAKTLIPGASTQGLGSDGKAFVGANTVRFSSLAARTPAFFKMVDNDLYHAIAEPFLKPMCGEYWLNTAQVMYIGPNSTRQELHRDAINWEKFLRASWPNPPEITISAMIGLDNVTEHLGATRVIPGSHKLLPSELENAQTISDDLETVPAEMGPGDALVYSGYVLHGGGANQDDQAWRKAMHMSFVAGWLTPEEAHPLDFTLGELEAQSPRVQRMLGHRSYDPRPHVGGGLWLRNVNAIEDPNGVKP